VFGLEEIIAVDRNSSGEIISFKTTTDRVISYQKALQEIEKGIITGVEIQGSNPTDEQFDNFPPIY
jgi:uncharacterized protein DUF3892